MIERSMFQPSARIGNSDSLAIILARRTAERRDSRQWHHSFADSEILLLLRGYIVTLTYYGPYRRSHKPVLTCIMHVIALSL
jgi:hypothetical protein